MFAMSIGMKKGETGRALLDEIPVGFEERRDAADAGADEDAEPIAVDLAGVERRILDGEHRGRDRELR